MLVKHSSGPGCCAHSSLTLFTNPLNLTLTMVAVPAAYSCALRVPVHWPGTNAQGAGPHVPGAQRYSYEGERVIT